MEFEPSKLSIIGLPGSGSDPRSLVLHYETETPYALPLDLLHPLQHAGRVWREDRVIAGPVDGRGQPRLDQSRMYRLDAGTYPDMHGLIPAPHADFMNVRLLTGASSFSEAVTAQFASKSKRWPTTVRSHMAAQSPPGIRMLPGEETMQRRRPLIRAFQGVCQKQRAEARKPEMTRHLRLTG